jgi:hypothetical protein
MALSGFLAVVAHTFAYDDPAPGLSHRGLLSIALAAAVVVLLTIHRRYGPRSLARAAAEYAVVAVLAGLLVVADTGVDRQPADHPTPTKAGQAKPLAETAVPDDRPAVLQVGAKVVRAVTGAAGWLVDLWRQADRKATPPKGQAMATPPRSPALSVLVLWRSP